MEIAAILTNGSGPFVQFFNLFIRWLHMKFEENSDTIHKIKCISYNSDYFIFK